MGENFEFRDGKERPQPAIRDRGKREVAKKANALEMLKVEYLPCSELSPNSYNPNRQSPEDFELLLRSIREDGFTQPIVALREGKVIVDGEHRWRAARKLGMAEVPVVLVDMTLEQMRIATLRHNRARGSEDIELSTELLRDLRELGALDWAKDSLMMDDDELQRLMADLPATEQLAGEAYSEAWVPVKEAEVSTSARQTDGGHEVQAESRATVQATEQAYKQAASAQTPEERAEILKKLEDGIFRIAVSFTGDEAVLVKKVLGLSPAVRLVELSKKFASVDFGGVK